MTTYRIYTENVNCDGIRNTLDLYFDAYTLIEAMGVWRSKLESSLVIELVLHDHETIIRGDVWYTPREAVKHVAEIIKTLNSQEAVLITSFKTETTLV